jgi:hypothetical protein
MGDSNKYVDIFFSYNDFESDVIKEILTREEIPFIVRDQRISPYPITIDHFPERRFSVPKVHADRARSLISDAVESGAIPADGAIVEDD